VYPQSPIHRDSGFSGSLIISNFSKIPAGHWPLSLVRHLTPYNIFIALIFSCPDFGPIPRRRLLLLMFFDSIPLKCWIFMTLLRCVALLQICKFSPPPSAGYAYIPYASMGRLLDSPPNKFICKFPCLSFYAASTLGKF